MSCRCLVFSVNPLLSIRRGNLQICVYLWIERGVAEDVCQSYDLHFHNRLQKTATALFGADKAKV